MNFAEIKKAFDMAKKKPELCKHGINKKFCDHCKPKKKDKIKFEGAQLSPDQVAAINTIISESGPFFLTGQAGSGKSFVVRYLKETVDDCVTCAMAGVAAQLIDSRTAHSFLGIIPVDDWLRKKRQAEGQPNPAYYLKMPKVSKKTGKMGRDWVGANVAKTRMLIIDEISMANAEFVQFVVARFKKSCGDDAESRKRWPKLVIVGDLLQLPPPEGERIFTNAGFEKFKVIQLVQQHRQADDADKDFLTALNEIRVGCLSEKTKELFKQRMVDTLPTNCTHLHAKNINVNETNMLRLQELPGESEEIRWEVDLIDSVDEDSEEVSTALHYAANKDNLKLTPTLTLKVGARVLLLTNDSADRWVNGSTGEVLSISDDFITIRMDRKGDIVDVPRAEEELRYGERQLGVIRQFPMKLGWALTIHKSQGMTMDKVGVNLSDHFDCGMTYVALSRCRYFDGLFLCGRFPDDIYVDEEALAFLETQNK